MKKVTKILDTEHAGRLQRFAPEYDCEVTELAIMNGGKARIVIQGSPENMQTLFDIAGVMLDEKPASDEK